MSISFEIFSKKLSDGKKFDELSQIEKDGWKAVDEHYTKKAELPTESATYELYKSKNKDALEFVDLPDNIKKIWVNLDKNYPKMIKVPIPKKEKETKAKIIVDEEKAKELKEGGKKKKQISVPKTKKDLKISSVAEKMENLKKLKGLSA